MQPIQFALQAGEVGKIRLRRRAIRRPGGLGEHPVQSRFADERWAVAGAANRTVPAVDFWRSRCRRLMRRRAAAAERLPYEQG